MSVIATIEPPAPAVKKRGRPKKVVPEDAGKATAASKKAGASKGSGMSAKTMKSDAKTTSTAKTGHAMRPVATTQSAPSAAARSTDTKTVSSDTTSSSIAATIAPQTTSRILEDVRATGTLNLHSTTTPTTTLLLQSSPSTQQPARAFHSTPTPHTNPHPSSPPNRPSKQRATTIPLPRSPLRAPSPKAAPVAPRPPPLPRPGSRVIEPSPDIRLPNKYKPAARRVTAILVGVPIILVVGWDLYGRWRGEVRRKWGGGAGEVIDKKRERGGLGKDV